MILLLKYFKGDKMRKIAFISLFSAVLLNATAPTTENVTKLYIATFKRAPDSRGLNYWVKDSNLQLEGIASSFFDQDETKIQYPITSTNTNFINSIYQNLFNRTPDTDGFEYWLKQIDEGKIEKSLFILAVVNGALDDDNSILKNKTTVGLVFASSGGESVESAKDIMEGIDADPSTVAKALEENNLLQESSSQETTNTTQQSSGVVVTESVNAEWNGGFCRNVKVSNPTDNDIIWEVSFKVDGDIYTLWNANYNQDPSSKILTANGVNWNKIAKAHASSEFGYCANTTTTDTEQGGTTDLVEPIEPTNPTPNNGNFKISDYKEVLGLSFQFYEAQRSKGPFPVVVWREPAGLSDGSDVGVDLSGGWFDAGDTLKFSLTIAYSTTMLNWGIVEFGDSYVGVGGYDREQIRYGLDYLMNAYSEGANPNDPSDDKIYYQVGDISADHNFWGPPEDMSMARPTYTCDSTRRCSEVAGEMVASFASGAIALGSDMHYASRLVEKAKKLYSYAKTYQGNNGYTASNGAYSSYSGYNDELAWGAIWLYMATNETTYLNDAKSFISLAQDGTYWGHNWDNVSNGAKLLLYKATKDNSYKSSLDQHFNYWKSGINYSSGGLAFLDKWGSLRYSSTTAFLSLVYAQALGSGDSSYSSLVSFARGQIDYILGDNPRDSSYVVGYGTNPPINPHHRASHNSTTHSINSPTNNEFTLKGALVGGPKSANDFDYKDDRGDYVANEVAIDYNAGFTGALGGLIKLGE
jgi:hypothetical protein